MSDSKKIRQFLNIMEGELIPNTRRTLKIDTDPYTLYRTLLRMPSPETYIQPNGNKPMGLMTFWDPVSFEMAKKKFDDFGIKYEEQAEGKMTQLYDKEHEDSEVFTISPVATNQAVGNDTPRWVDSAPTAKSKPKVQQGPSTTKPVKKN